MFSDFTRKTIRNRIQDHLIQTCEIQRRSFTQDDFGGSTALPVQSTTESCFLTRLTRAGQDMVQDADKGRIFYELQLPFDADIQDNDRVVIDTITYEVAQAVRANSNDVMRQAIVMKVGS